VDSEETSERGRQISLSERNMKKEDSSGVSRAILLLSGGLDSATLLYFVRHELKREKILALSFIYGQRHARELEMARYQAQRAGVVEHQVLDISFFGDLTAGRTALSAGGLPVPDLDELDDEARRQPPTYVPHRNLLFLSLAAATAESAGIQDVFYGAQAQDAYGYWDCTQAFVDRLNDVLSLNRDRAVTVHAPFASKSKAEIVKIGLALDVDYAHTWTCYRGQAQPCETCPSCVEREAAFKTANARDPLMSGNGGQSPRPV